jgi:hypothetical protein
MRILYTLIIVLVIAHSSAAQTLSWAKAMVGTEDSDGGAIALDAAGNVYMVGTFKGTVDFLSGPGNYDLTANSYGETFVAKLTNQGELIWVKQMGGSLNTEAGFIKVDADNNLYIYGNFNGTTDVDPGPAKFNVSGLQNVFLVKLDSSGSFIWATTFGAQGNERTSGLGLDTAGNVYICGQFENSVDFDPGPNLGQLSSSGPPDIFVVKLTDSGTLTWAKRFASQAQEYIVPIGLAVEPGGDLVLNGYFSGTVDFDPSAAPYQLSAQSSDVFVVKLDILGNMVWARQIGGTGHESAGNLAISSTGDVYMGGNFTGTADFDPGSGTHTLTSVEPVGLFVCRLTASGDFSWARQMANPVSLTSDGIIGMGVDGPGNLYVTGFFQDIADLDPGPQVLNFFGNGHEDAFICKVDTSGNLIWASTIGGTGADYAGLTIGADGYLYLPGRFAATVDFDPGPGTYMLTSGQTATADGNIFVMKMAPYLTSIKGLSRENTFSVYPNPFEDVVTIAASGKIGVIKIFDAKGSEVRKLRIDGNKANIDLGELPKGLYLISAGDNGSLRLIRR